MSDNEFCNKIDVTNELIKMGINIVVPQVAPTISLKTLNEADFVGNHVNQQVKNNLNEDSEAVEKKKQRRRKKTNSPKSLVSSSSMLNSIQASVERKLTSEQLDGNNINFKQRSENKNKGNLGDAVMPPQAQPKIQNQQLPSQQNNQNKNSKIKTSASMPTMNNNNINQFSYDPYWTDEQIKRGLENNGLIQGKIRINQRNFEDAFLSDVNGGGDIYICGVKDRNRALNNDIVAVRLKEKYTWKILDQYRNQVIAGIKKYESENKINNELSHLLKSTSLDNNDSNNKLPDLIDLAPLTYSKADLLNSLDENWFQRTGVVVGIIEKKNSRYAAGHLKLFTDRSKDWVLFSPNDSRLPRMKIKISECPADFYTNSKNYANTLFIAQITDIPLNSKYAFGELKKSIGLEGDVEVETEAILIENGIDYSEFDEKVNECLPKTPWCVPPEEYTKRRDLRNICVFTIDPATARDLDDALHCIKLSDDLYEVGVHIADVSYFVTEDSLVDKYASERTTSVYLVQKVIPMLPRLLCEQLCSLNPATDRLTFSVIWKIKSNGEIVEEWFGRTVINSAVKLSYEHAQSFIENPTREFDVAEFPPIREQFNLCEIKACVLNLHMLSKSLRAIRFKNGCLTLNQVKLNFVINKECGLPYGYNVYQQKDSNILVEEFMLLANIAVAHRIYDKYPTKSILRRHPYPNTKQLDQLGECIRSHGFECDISSSSNIQTIQKENSVSSLTLVCLLTKTMQLAQYFCSKHDLPKDYFYHYGLAVPLYTHFTSPIRRYPDVLVHRLLASSLGYCKETERDFKLLQAISENCNDKKYGARVCSERSSEMFFALFINECGPLEEIATVIQIRDRSFDVLIVNLGISKRVYFDRLEIVPESINYIKNELKPEISWQWQQNESHPKPVNQKLELFSKINVILSKHENDKLKFNVILKHPHDKIIRTTANNLLQEEINQNESLYNQRMDIDPYICD